MRGKAYPTAGDPDRPPLDATLTRVDYDLQLEGSLASGRATITVDVLKDGWVRVPIPPGLLVNDARIGNSRVALAPTPGKSGELSAILPHRGRSVLALDVAFAVNSANGEERLVLPTGASGITRATLNQPPPGVEVTIGGGFATEKSPARWVAYAGGGNLLTFIWHRKVEERRTQLPLRMQGTLTQLFGLGEDSTSVNAEAGIEVLQGAAQQVRIAVPPNVTINQVPGATVADWDVKNGELVVNFLEPVEHAAKFAIGGEIRLPREGAFELPLMRLLGVERENGGIAAEVLGAGEIRETKPVGLEAVEPADLGPAVAAHQSPSMAAFVLRPGTSTRSLSLNLVRYTQQAVLTANIEEARYRILLSPDGKALVQARYALRNNQRSFARITLPANATVWSTSVADRPVRPGKAPDGGLLFPLAKARAGEEVSLFAIEVLYLVRGGEWSAKGEARLPLPSLDLPISRTGVAIYYSPLFRVTAETGAFHAQTYEKPASPVLNGEEGFGGNIEPATANGTTSNSAIQALVDRYRASSDSRRSAAAMPTGIAFPAVGPSLYLAAELTAENHAPVAALTYQKDKKGGVR